MAGYFKDPFCVAEDAVCGAENGMGRGAAFLKGAGQLDKILGNVRLLRIVVLAPPRFAW